MSLVKRSVSIRRALLISAATATLGAPGVAQAQGSAAASTEVEEVVVTGSRLPRSGFDTVYPVQVVDGDRIRASGEFSLGDVLFQAPSAGVAPNAQNAASSSLFGAGQARVNLRGLQTSRTLVLVDGRRHIFSDAQNPAVDINMIPKLMIERIEVTPGGASAVYGSEAIAGVVNVITRKRFEGFEGDVSAGISEEGDGEEYTASVLYGWRSKDDRLHLMLGGEIGRSEPILQRDRDWAYPGLRRNNTVTPQTVIPQSRTNQTIYGVFQLQPTVAVARDVRNPAQIVQLSAACATATPNALCQDEALGYLGFYGSLQARVERDVVSGKIEYELADDFTLFTDLSYAKVEGYGILSPAFSTATGAAPLPVVIRGDNAFLNGAGATAQALRTAWTAAGKTLVQATTANVARSFIEFGGRNVDTDRSTFRIVTGAKGDFETFGRGVNWDTYVQYGRMEGASATSGMPQVARLTQAVDAVLVNGQAACRDAAARTAGCVPFDLVNGPSQAAVDWVNAVSTTNQVINQTVVAANFTTSLADLPAGPIQLAAGGEYRNEKSSFAQDPLSAAGALFQNVIGTRAGGYHVSEAYAEVGVPLLADLPLIHRLRIEGAGRLANYSTIGNTEQYRLAAEWSPVKDILIRASQGTAVRAPNIPELYAPQSTSFVTSAVDPCDRTVFAGSTAAQQAARRVHCAAAIANYNPATFNSNFGGAGRNLVVLGGGNPNLGPETAHNYQLGISIQPRFVPGLRVSLDYFKYNIANGISTTPLNALLGPLCYDSTVAYASNPFCAAIMRDTAGTATGVVGGVSQVNNTLLNAQKVKLEGYDYALAYSFDTADLVGQDLGRIDIEINATWMYRYHFQSLPNVGFIQLIGAVDQGLPPEWKATGYARWTYRDLSLGWTTRYLGTMRASSAFTPSQLNPYYTGDHYEHDLAASYRFGERLTVRGGAINLTDAKPPALPETFAGTGVGSAQYDNRGRFFYVGASYRY